MSDPEANRHGDALTGDPVRESVRRLTRRCGQCGVHFTSPYRGGRPPVVCAACRATHAAALAAQRMRRYRQRQQERAEHGAYSRERQAAYQARRLLAEHPAAVAVLLQRVSPEVADLVIDELLRLDAAAAAAPYQAAAQRPEG